MIRKLLTTVFATLLIVSAFAISVMSQEKGKGVTKKGFKVGVNIANFSGSDKDSFANAFADTLGVTTTGFKRRTGIVFGGFITFGITRNFAIQPELAYVQKGAKSTLDGVEVTIALNYIEIPILATILFPSSNGKVAPRVFAGPYASLKSSSTLSGQGASIDIKQVKSTDFGIVAGAGLDFKTGDGAFLLEGRYTIGLSAVDDPPSPWNSTANALDVKNSGFSILAGYSF